jgi:hypothetical protein
MTATYSSIVNVGYASRTNTTINVPASTANGNLLLMGHVTAAATTAPTQTLPGGWTQIGSTQTVSDAGGFQGRIVHAYRVASSEPASYTVTHSVCSASGWIMRITGSSTLAVNASSQNHTAAGVTGTTMTATSVTTTSANQLLVFSSLNWNIGALTSPVGMSEVLDSQFLYVAVETIASAGATGTRVQANAPAPWFANLIAVNDGAAAAKPVKVWSGSAWVTKPVKVWSGSAWVTKPAKVWNGAAWV